MDYMLRMYGNNIQADNEIKNDKKLSRVIGGIKAQGADHRLVNIDNQDIEIPKIEYIRILEQQIKEIRNKNHILENKVSRLQDQLSTSNSRIKSLEDDNKRNPLRFRRK